MERRNFFKFLGFLSIPFVLKQSTGNASEVKASNPEFKPTTKNLHALLILILVNLFEKMEADNVNVERIYMPPETFKKIDEMLSNYYLKSNKEKKNWKENRILWGAKFEALEPYKADNLSEESHPYLFMLDSLKNVYENGKLIGNCLHDYEMLADCNNGNITVLNKRKYFSKCN